MFFTSLVLMVIYEPHLVFVKKDSKPEATKDMSMTEYFFGSDPALAEFVDCCIPYGTAKREATRPMHRYD